MYKSCMALWLFIIIAVNVYSEDQINKVEFQPSSQGCFTAWLSAQLVSDSKISADVFSISEDVSTDYTSAFQLNCSRTGFLVTVPETQDTISQLVLTNKNQKTIRVRLGGLPGISLHYGNGLSAMIPPADAGVTGYIDIMLPLTNGKCPIAIVSPTGKPIFFLQSGTPGTTSYLNLIQSKAAAAAACVHIAPSRRFIGSVPLRFTFSNKSGFPAGQITLNVRTKLSTPDGTLLAASPLRNITFPLTGTASYSITVPQTEAWQIKAQTEFLQNDTIIHTHKQYVYAAKNIKSAIDDFKQQLQSAEQKLQRRLPNTGLQLEIAAELQSKTSHTSAIGERLTRIMESIPDLLETEQAGKDPLKGKTGFMEAAFFDETDQSYQPYFRYVPASYSSEEAAPLFIYLHGYVPSYSKAEWEGAIPDLNRQMEQTGSLLAMPFGRSNTDFQTIGEADVMRVLKEMQDHYSVDPRRIYLIGYSMGGSGMWTIIQHYPDIFAAGISMGGRTDYYYWHDLKRDQLPQFRQQLINNNNPIDVPGNFQHKAFWIFHGSQDVLVKYGHSSRMHALLQEHDISSTFTPIQMGLHWIASTVFREYNLTGWALKHQKTAFPLSIDYTSHNPKYSKAWWLQINAFTDRSLPARIQADWNNGNPIITIDNIRQFTIAVPDTHTGPGLTGTVNNTAVTLLINENRIAAWGKAAPSQLHGPVKEAFNEPFTVVYSQSREADARRFCQEWSAFAKGNPPCIASADITPEIENSRNLILFENPEEESYLSGILDKMPVTITDKEFGIGTKKVGRKNRGLLCIYPNPNNPQKYIVIHAGTYWGNHLPINHKFDHIPDYIIYEPVPESDGFNKPVIAGFFTPAWKAE